MFGPTILAVDLLSPSCCFIQCLVDRRGSGSRGLIRRVKVSQNVKLKIGLDLDYG